MREFYNRGVGKCVILKESEISNYTLVYAIFSDQFILASDLDKKTGTWGNGHYYGKRIEDALNDYNRELKIRKEALNQRKEELDRQF